MSGQTCACEATLREGALYCPACGVNSATGKRRGPTTLVVSGAAWLGGVGVLLGVLLATGPRKPRSYVVQDTPRAVYSPRIASGAPGSTVRRDVPAPPSIDSAKPRPAVAAPPPAVVIPPVATAEPASEAAPTAPCTRAHASESGDPLGAALKAIDKRAAKPADSAQFVEAARLAQRATEVDTTCAEAWSVLAFARYRAAYQVCGAGEYGEAEAAARKAIELAASDATVRAAALRNLGRIQAARLQWDEAEKSFNEAGQLLPDNREVRSWLDELETRKAIPPKLVEAAKKAMAGEVLTAEDTAGLDQRHISWLENAPMVRHGRRLNTAVGDWFYYCDGSPLNPHGTVDPNASRNPVQKGTPDFENAQYLRNLRSQLRASSPRAPAPAAGNPFGD